MHLELEILLLSLLLHVPKGEGTNHANMRLEKRERGGGGSRGKLARTKVAGAEERKRSRMGRRSARELTVILLFRRGVSLVASAEEEEEKKWALMKYT